MLNQGKSCVPFQETGCFLDCRLFWKVNTLESRYRGKHDVFFFEPNGLEEWLHLRDDEFISLFGPVDKVQLVDSDTHLQDAKTSSQNSVFLSASTLKAPFEFRYVSIDYQNRTVCLGGA
jgi:hypothetical protein